MKTKTYDCKTCMYDGSKPHSAYWQNCQTCGSNNKSNYVYAKKTARTIEQIATKTAKQVIIEAPGDPSVGMLSTNWTLDGELYFEDSEEQEYFRTGIKQLFENYTGDRVNVMFDFEIPAE